MSEIELAEEGTSMEFFSGDTFRTSSISLEDPKMEMVQRKQHKPANIKSLALSNLSKTTSESNPSCKDGSIISEETGMEKEAPANSHSSMEEEKEIKKMSDIPHEEEEEENKTSSYKVHKKKHKENSQDNPFNIPNTEQ